MAQVKLQIASETGRLQACVLCAPGAEFDAMVPAHIAPLLAGPTGWQPNPDYLLFDDLVLLDHMRNEHADLRAIVAAVTGERACLDLRHLLEQTLTVAAARTEVVAEVVALEAEMGGASAHLCRLRARLDELPPSDLTRALVTGLDPDDETVLLRCPAPNLLFTRDIWAVVGDTVVLGYPRARARKRDGVLARAIVRWHPLFAGARLVDIRQDLVRQGPEMQSDLCIEGGDITVVRSDVVLIGLGERTTRSAAVAAAQQLARHGVKHVLGVQLPMARATMHLDTVLTWIEPGRALAYLPALQATNGGAAEIVDLVDGQRSLQGDLLQVLASLGVHVELVPCGGDDARAAEREQWSDGANAFCLGPGRIVLYGRNTATLRALNRLGYEVLTPAQLVTNAELLCQGDRRWVVALPGSELSRGRGGPRCLTLPLARFS